MKTNNEKFLERLGQYLNTVPESQIKQAIKAHTMQTQDTKPMSFGDLVYEYESSITPK